MKSSPPPATSGSIVEQNDYYPFGTRHANGLTSLSANRWRFSGKEEQDTAFGIPYSDFGARLYDRTAWTAIDPLAEKYYNVSPYVYCVGRPLLFVDRAGSTIVIWYMKEGELRSFSYSGVEDKIPDNEYVSAVIEAYKYNKENWDNAGFEGNSPSTILVENRNYRVSVYKEIGEPSKYYQDNGGIPRIIWNPYEGFQTDLGVILSPATIFSHEADHAIDDLFDARSHSKRRGQRDSQYDTEEEKRVITGSEQKTAFANGEIKHGQVTRRNHKGSTVYTIGASSIIIDKGATDFYQNHYRK